MACRNMSSLVDQIRGVSYKPEDVHDYLDDSSITLLRANNIVDGAIELSDVVYVDRKCVSESQILQRGDILICASSGSKNLVGKAAQFMIDGEYTFGAFCKVVRPREATDFDYISMFFQSSAYRREISSVAIGININNIRNEHIDSLSVSWPDADERKVIVEQLQSLMTVIQSRQRQLRAFDTLIKARFVEMFGDPKTNPYDYPLHHLSEYILYLTSGSRGWAQYCNDNGLEWFITIKNVKDCRITTANMQAIDPPDNAEAKRTRVQEGDLLISITADLGRTGVVTKEIADHGAYINQHLTCIRLDRTVLEPLYVAYFMESAAGKEQFEAKNQTGVKAGLNFNSINSLKLLVPPIAIQREFLEFVSQVDKSKVV